MIEQLELQKPPPAGPKQEPNIPLLLAIIVLLVGLILVFVNLTETKFSLIFKCVGPCLVMFGLTTMLLRILFSYTPTFCKGSRSKRKKANKEVILEKMSDTKEGVVNHGIELSNDEACINDMTVKSDNLRARHSKLNKRGTSSQPSDNGSIKTSSDDDSFLSSVEFENDKIRRGRERRKAKKEEIVLDVSNII